MKYFLSGIFLLVVKCLFAQDPFDKAIIYDLEQEDAPLVFTFPDGFLTSEYHDEDSNNEDLDVYKYIKYDVNFSKIDSIYITIDKAYKPHLTSNSNNRAHTYFAQGKKNVFVTVDFKTLKVTKVEGTLPHTTNTRKMVVYGDHIYLLNSKWKSDYYFVVNWRTGEIKKQEINIPGYTGWNSIGFQVLSDTSEALLYIYTTSESNSRLSVVRLNPKGEAIDTLSIPHKEEKKMAGISACKVGTDHYIFSGLYYSGTMDTPSGVFFLELLRGGEKIAKYYSFTQVKSYLTRLPNEEAKRIENGLSKSLTSTSYHSMNIHPLIAVKDGYILVGEVVEPYYVTKTTSSGTQVTHQGYNHDFATVMKFSKNGDLLWDHSFTLGFLSKTAANVLSIPSTGSETIDMIFPQIEGVGYTSIDINGQSFSDPYFPAFSWFRENDRKVTCVSAFSEYWYAGHGITYGELIIKNKEDDDVKNNRTIFHITKVKLVKQ